ncbi:MAG: site-specific integrase [Pseudomonadota bacterium]
MYYQRLRPEAGAKLHSDGGERYYLSESERRAFIEACQKLPRTQKSFCLMLVYTGVRLSEARYLKCTDFCFPEKMVLIRTLKRREEKHFRYLPLPVTVAMTLEAQRLTWDKKRIYLWSEIDQPPPRIQCYRWVKQVMEDLGLEGPRASPKGLRHTFGAHAINTGIQLQMLQRWMGHANIETTAGYTTIVGQEERELASRMWE